jgi:hypothetical protein
MTAERSLPLVQEGGPPGPTHETKALRGLRCGAPLPLVEVGGPPGPTLETKATRRAALDAACPDMFEEPDLLSDPRNAQAGAGHIRS